MAWSKPPGTPGDGRKCPKCGNNLSSGEYVYCSSCLNSGYLSWNELAEENRARRDNGTPTITSKTPWG